MTFGELTSGKSSDFEYEGRQLWGCGPWRWYIGVGRIHMNRGRVGEERGGKEKDRCPFTTVQYMYRPDLQTHPMTLSTCD
jgi:hypothetical protein